MAKKKPAIKQVSQRNELIQKLEGSEYIKNPMTYAQIIGDFKLTQYNVLLSVARTLQKRIDEHIVENKGIQGPIITEKDLDKNHMVSFKFQLTELGVDSKEYDNVEKACEELQSLAVTHYEYNEQGERRYVRNVLFPEMSIPSSEDVNGKKRRLGYVELKMNGHVAKALFNHSNQYIEHLGGIAKMCRSPRTPRLYVYLSAWKKTHRSIEFKYESVKEYLGYLDYNDSHTTIIKDRCPTWAHFKRDVLEPARKELKKLAEQGKVEFYFEFEPIYKNGSQRGNPDKLKFELLPTIDLLDEIEEIKEEEKAKTISELWMPVLKDLADRVGEENYSIWIEPIVPISYTDNILTLKVPSAFFAEYLENNLIDKISPTIIKHFGENVKLQYNIP